MGAVDQQLPGAAAPPVGMDVEQMELSARRAIDAGPDVESSDDLALRLGHERRTRRVVEERRPRVEPARERVGNVAHQVAVDRGGGGDVDARDLGHVVGRRRSDDHGLILPLSAGSGVPRRAGYSAPDQGSPLAPEGWAFVEVSLSSSAPAGGVATGSPPAASSLRALSEWANHALTL